MGKNVIPMEELNIITGAIIDSAIQVHKQLGPGLLKSAYEACLAYELTEKGMKARCQVDLPLIYKGMKMGTAYRLDMLVEECVIVELKSVERLLPIHEAQLLSYLKLSARKVGLLINFNERYLKNGIKRLAN